MQTGSKEASLAFARSEQQRVNPFVGHPQPYPGEAHWRAIGVACVDGDTYDVLVDQGWDPVMSVRRIRLDGADTWEVIGEHAAKGAAARAFVETFIVGRPLYIVTRKRTTSDAPRQSAERYIARVLVWVERVGSTSGGAEWVDLALILRQTEHVKR